MTDIVNNRYDFVYLFDVTDGNPNGDPDLANMPRFDPETGHGLVSDVCLKSKIRRYVQVAKFQNGNTEPGYDIFIQQGKSLESHQKLPYMQSSTSRAAGFKTDPKDVARARTWMCEQFFDIRTFGAVMATTEYNCGQVRGPVQITFSRTIDPVLSMQHTITRKCHTTDRDQKNKGGAIDIGTIGNKHTVAYGLYRAHGFVSPNLASHTGFTKADLDLLWTALANMFDLDRAASRGLIAARHLYVFEHNSMLGAAPAHKLFELVEITRKSDVPRSIADYAIPTHHDISSKLSAFPGVTIVDKLS